MTLDVVSARYVEPHRIQLHSKDFTQHSYMCEQTGLTYSRLERTAYMKAHANDGIMKVPVDSLACALGHRECSTKRKIGREVIGWKSRGSIQILRKTS